MAEASFVESWIWLLLCFRSQRWQRTPSDCDVQHMKQGCPGAGSPPTHCKISIYFFIEEQIRYTCKQGLSSLLSYWCLYTSARKGLGLRGRGKQSHTSWIMHVKSWLCVWSACKQSRSWNHIHCYSLIHVIIVATIGLRNKLKLQVVNSHVQKDCIFHIRALDNS